MSMLGEDFAGGLFRRLYWPWNPGGALYGVAVAVVLIALHMALEFALAMLALILVKSDPGNMRDVVKASLVIIFPASLGVAAIAWWLAGLRGGIAPQVLNFRKPGISPLGWVVLIVCFILVMYGAIMAIVLALGIDVSQYTPGPHGQSPKTGSAGLVKEAMFDIANDPVLFLAVFPSIAIGAPLAEELIFRGQLFTALSSTRLGVSGTTVLTAAAWALLHATEPWLSIGLIFIMGLVFGYLMYRFGSIWVTMACHGVWNGFYALLIFASLRGGL